MRAKKKSASIRNLSSIVPQADFVLRHPVFASVNPLQRQNQANRTERSATNAGFNFGNISVLSGDNGLVQRSCASCSKEYAVAAYQNRAVSQGNLCPKCRSAHAGQQVATKSLSERVAPGLQQRALTSGWYVNRHAALSGQEASNDSPPASSASPSLLSYGSDGWQTQSTFDQSLSVKPAVPSKALGETEETGEAKPRPYAGSATIQCNGSGDYEIVYNGWAGAKCGTKSCVTAHESSHIADWKAKWPSGCTGRPKGYLPKGDPPHDKPLMTVAEYKAFLKKSECKAHTVDLNCAKALPKKGACKKTVEDYIALTEKQLKKWCPSKALIGAAIGAIIGGGVGAAVGGPVGAAVGGIGGAIVGGVVGSLL